MKMSDKGLLFLMREEGVVLSSYKDSKGIWTIGVGHTANAGSPIPTPGLKLTLKQAFDLFKKDVHKYEQDVIKALQGKQVAQHEFDALVSFHFNTGGIFRAKLTEALVRGDRNAAIQGFMGWLKPKEIIGRRKREQALFAKAAYGDLSKVACGDTNRSMVPTPTDQIFEGKVESDPLVDTSGESSGGKDGQSNDKGSVLGKVIGFILVALATAVAAIIAGGD